MDEIEYDLKHELDKGERILWSGKPDCWRQGLQYLPFTMVGSIWVVGPLSALLGSKGQPPQTDDGFVTSGMPVFLILFVLLGLCIALTPIWAAYTASVTVYGVTNLRIIILCRTISKNVRSYYASDLGPLVRTERSDGSGTLVFKMPHPSLHRKQQAILAEQLVGIGDVSRVEQIIRQALKCSDSVVTTEP